MFNTRRLFMVCVVRKQRKQKINHHIVPIMVELKERKSLTSIAVQTQHKKPFKVKQYSLAKSSMFVKLHYLCPRNRFFSMSLLCT